MSTAQSTAGEGAADEPPDADRSDDIALFHEAIRFSTAFAVGEGLTREQAVEVGLRAATILWQRRGTPAGYDRSRKLEPYMSVVVARLIVEDHRRSESEDERAGEWARESEKYQREWMDPETPVMDQEREHILYRALDRVPSVCREVFVLKTEQDLSDAEIAKVVGILEVSVRSYLHRARHVLASDRRLRTYLKEER